MSIEERELYLYTTDHYEKDLSKISKDCVAPLIEVRQVVKKAINQYNYDYCPKGENCFSEENFQNVSKAIYNDIMNK